MTKTVRFNPRTTHGKAVRKAVKNYKIDVNEGRIYDQEGFEVGNFCRPTLTIHLDNKTYAANVSKIIGYLVFGPPALYKRNQIRHLDGDIYNNRRDNLVLVPRTNRRNKTLSASA